MLATLRGATPTGRTSIGRATGGIRPGVSRPTILMPAWTTTAAQGQFRMQATDAACIEAISAVGGEVILVPLCSPFAGEDALGLVLHASASRRDRISGPTSQRVHRQLAPEPLFTRLLSGPQPVAPMTSDASAIQASAEGGNPCLFPNT